MGHSVIIFALEREGVLQRGEFMRTGGKGGSCQFERLHINFFNGHLVHKLFIIITKNESKLPKSV